MGMPGSRSFRVQQAREMLPDRLSPSTCLGECAGMPGSCRAASGPELGFASCTKYSPNFISVLGTLNESSPKSLHSVVILFLVLSLSTSLLSSGFTFYNSISNPYQTFLGPLGVYTWSGLSGEYTGAGPWPRNAASCPSLLLSHAQAQSSHATRRLGAGGPGLFLYIYSID